MNWPERKIKMAPKNFKRSRLALIPLVAVLHSLGGQAFAHAAPDMVYRVPVTDPALEPFATFQVDSETYGKAHNPGKFTFVLPAELTGDAREFTLARDPNTPGLWMDQVTGHCRKTAKRLSCRVAFHDLKVDPALVASHLNAHGVDPAELKARLQVAAQFEHEPIGVITYTLR